MSPLSNATNRPSAEIEGRSLGRVVCAPPGPTLIRVVSPVSMSCTNTSV
jgi:hypothetical protein